MARLSLVAAAPHDRPTCAVPLLFSLVLLSGCVRALEPAGDSAVPPDRDAPRDLAADSVTRDRQAQAHELLPDRPLSDGLDPTACDDLHASSMICEPFEDPSLPGWTQVATAGGKVSQSLLKPLRGTGSLWTSTPGTGSMAQAQVTKAFSAKASGTLAARGYFYLGAAPTDLVVVLKLATADWSEGSSITLAPNGEVTVYSSQSGQLASASGVVPVKRWFCLELRVGVHATSGWLEARVDGKLVATKTAIDTTLKTAYENLQVGQQHTYAGLNAMEIWVDEVVADTAPIGCE